MLTHEGAGFGGMSGLRDRIDHVRRTLSCHGSVRTGRR